jgi:hypothetical protein
MIDATGGATATQMAINALKTGQDIDKTLGPADGEESQNELDESLSEEAPQEVSSKDSESKPEEKPEITSDIEELLVSDEQGRRKVKIDWNDRESIKKQISLAHGARKWQSDKDKVSKDFEAYKAESKDKVDTYDILDKTFRNQGAEGVLKLLAGEDGLKQYKARITAEAEFLAKASPEQKKAYEIEQVLQQERAEKQRLVEEQKAFLAKLESEKKAAEEKQFESIINPAFEKYRFQGKLGDEVTEHHLDQAIWTQTLARLETLPEEQLTASNIEKEFRTVAAAFGKAIGKQASETAKKVVESKKADAKVALTTAAIKGMKSNTTSSEVKDKIAKGNLTDALRDIFSGKKIL